MADPRKGGVFDLMGSGGRSMHLWQRKHVELPMDVVCGDDGSRSLKSDRCMAHFASESEMEAFARRNSKFLVLMHHPNHANRAGFLFELSPRLGLPDDPGSSLMLYLAALGVEGEAAQGAAPVAENMDFEQVAQAMSLMQRAWKLDDGQPDLVLDGSWDSFLAFFMAASIPGKDAGSDGPSIVLAGE